MNGQRILLAVTALWLGLSPAMSANYYRFTPGKGPASSGGSTGTGTGATGTATTDPVTKTDPDVPVDAQLAFSQADDLSGSYPANASVEANYQAAGGTAPYFAEATGLPDGLYLFQTGADTWTVQGSVGLQGSYPNGAVTVTDAAGATATKAIAMTVLGNAPMTVVSQFPSTASIQGGGNLDVSAFFKGGSGSYDFAVADPKHFGANGYATSGGAVYLSGSTAVPGTYPLKVTVTDTASQQAVSYDIVTVTVSAPPPFSAVSSLDVRRQDGQPGTSMTFVAGGGERYFQARGLVRGGSGDGYHRTVTVTESQASKFQVQSSNTPCDNRPADCQALPGYAAGDTLIEVTLTPLEPSQSSTLSVSVGDTGGQTVTFAPVALQVN